MSAFTPIGIMEGSSMYAAKKGKKHVKGRGGKISVSQEFMSS